MLNLLLKRELGTKDYTFGKLYINGVYECETIEDEVREIKGRPVKEWKIKAITAIPFGNYKIELYDSPRFKRVLPILRGVDGFDYVLIHPGNTADNTEGCILVGTGRYMQSITNSRVAFNKLFPKIEKALKAGQEVWLTVQ